MAVETKSSTVSKILTLQILLVIIITSGCYIVYGFPIALSPLLGGLIAFIPNLYFALRIANNSAEQDAKKIMRSFYAGESGKLILTAILFYIAFKVPNITLLPLLTGYVAVVSIFWFALLMRD